MKIFLCVCAFSVNYTTFMLLLQYKIKGGENQKSQKHKNQKAQSTGRKLSTSSLSKNNDRFIKNLSKANLTDNQIKLLSKGLKFIPTATVTKNKIWRQLL